MQKNWQELIKPNKLDVESGVDSTREATIVAQPLERGFGLTLGNALRRVLLSSLQGAAITSVQIDGVLHEFSSVPGVREDVTDLVLNLKAIALRMHGEGPKRIILKAAGPGDVTASIIDTGSSARMYSGVSVCWPVLGSGFCLPRNNSSSGRIPGSWGEANSPTVTIER